MNPAKAPIIRRVGTAGRVTRRAPARALIALGLIALAIGAVGIATAAMRSVQLAPKLCETTGGGRFVKIPGFPGEFIDRRLKNDIAWMRERYKIFVTDGYSLDPVHSRNGEHPIGLALDIVPDFANGGRWRKINRLAAWAEPVQDKPRPPFRWVGYNGDPGHGRGHHLHLSYMHSPTPYNDPARKVWTVLCPTPKDTTGSDTGGDSGGTGTSGGIAARSFRLERPHPETGGVSAP